MLVTLFATQAHQGPNTPSRTTWPSVFLLEFHHLRCTQTLTAVSYFILNLPGLLTYMYLYGSRINDFTPFLCFCSVKLLSFRKGKLFLLKFFVSVSFRVQSSLGHHRLFPPFQSSKHDTASLFDAQDDLTIRRTTNGRAQIRHVSKKSSQVHIQYSPWSSYPGPSVCFVSISRRFCRFLNRQLTIVFRACW